MLPESRGKLSLLVLLVLILCLGSLSQLFAQDATQEPLPISVSYSEPAQITSGQSAILSVIGANFTEQTTVRLVGIGLLEVTFVNSGALTAVLPADLPSGQYGIEVSDPGGGTVSSPNTLKVNPPPQPLPTAAPPTLVPTQVPTLEPPTPVPGQPSLIVRDFAAVPSIVTPGGPVGLTFVLLNQGNRTAQGVSVSLDSGGKFFPANGQAGAALPDMPPGSSVQVSLNAMAASDASAGPTNIPITMAYHDFEGKAYTGKADLGVEVAPLDEIAQVTLVSYSVEPQPAAPGDPVAIHVLVSNTGNETASRVLLRITRDDKVLLAGGQGDTFPLGDMAPGQDISIDLPMRVDPAVSAGPHSQGVTISYMQGSDAKEITTTITVEIARVVKPQPLILLENYTVGDSALSPGDRFTLSMTLHNVGQADAAETLVTFGAVDVPPPSSSGSGDGGAGSGSGSNPSSAPSNAFAPLGAGDTLFLGNLAASSSMSVQQDFIVNSTVTSGIYSLPITVRYQKSDGSADQQSLHASVIVISPLRVQTSLAAPLPDSVNIGEPLPVALKVSNHGANTFNLTSAAVTAKNADVLEGATMLLSPIKTDKDGTVNATIQPSAEGEFSVTFTLTYTDDLNREQTMITSYTGQAVTPPAPPDTTVEIPPSQVDQQQEDNLLGRLLLGFLGLGG